MPVTKAKPKAKKAATPAKKAVKAKPKLKKPVAKKTSAKKVSVKKAVKANVPTTKYGISEQEKIDLLQLIDEIIQVRLHKAGGLKSFFLINKILNRYNQKFTTIETKFNAIVAHGVEKYNAHAHPHHGVYLVVDGMGKDEMSLYKVLWDIEHDKIPHQDIKNKLQDVLHHSQQT